MRRIAWALIAASLSASAAAAPLTAQQVLQQFNLVTLGSVTSSSHVDGRSYIGGSVSGGDYVQHPGDVAASSYAGLTVAGSASNLHVNGNGAVILGSLSNGIVNSGAAYVSGALSSDSHLNGGTLSSGSSAVMAATSTDFATTLRLLSSSLSGLKDTGSTVTFNGTKAIFNATANSSGLAVFDLTANNLDTRVFAESEFEFNLGSAKTVIINVDDKNVTSRANFLGGSAQKIANNVIWNFYNASEIALDSQFGGTILATSAHLTNGNNIEGSVLVNTLTQQGEIHASHFAGNIGSVSTVPEPETLSLTLGGLALMMLVARRRRA